MESSDIIIIGAGPGGYETALRAAGYGKSVILVEVGPVGGTCLNSGCIPTKSLCRSASVLEDMKSSGLFGVRDLHYSFDFSAAVSRKDDVVAQLRSGVESLISSSSLVTLVRGKAAFTSSGTVIAGGSEYRADDIIIATGSVPVVPDIPGADDPDVVTSASLLSSEELPDRLCVIGAGVIGMELASVMSSFGSEVTVLESFREILPRYDTDIARRLRQILSRKGISISTQASVTGIERSRDGLHVKFTCKGKEYGTVADKVLVAVGRRPDMSAMNFSDAGIECTPRGIAVDRNMQTSVPHIYAIGDAAGGYMLAHVAVAQGRVALAHILGRDDAPDLSLVPSAAFTIPEAASVGMTEEQCQESGMQYHTVKSYFRSNGKAACIGDTDGMCKIIVEGEKGSASGRIAGCHILGPHASDLIQEANALISCGATLEKLSSIIHPHPTLSEIFML